MFYLSIIIFMCITGVPDQANLWQHDQPEASGLWGGGEADWRHHDPGHHRDVRGGRPEVPAHTHQDTLPLQPQGHLQGTLNRPPSVFTQRLLLLGSVKKRLLFYFTDIPRFTESSQRLPRYKARHDSTLDPWMLQVIVHPTHRPPPLTAEVLSL